MPMMSNPAQMIRLRGNAFDPAQQHYQAWQNAAAELEALKATGPLANPWMPETRKGANGTQYLVNDKWWDQRAWDDPSFQRAIVDPYRQTFEKQAAEEFQKKMAQAMERANMAQFEYENYLARQDELKAMQPRSSMGVGGAGTNNRMMGVGRR